MLRLNPCFRYETFLRSSEGKGEDEYQKIIVWRLTYCWESFQEFTCYDSMYSLTGLCLVITTLIVIFLIVPFHFVQRTVAHKLGAKLDRVLVL